MLLSLYVREGPCWKRCLNSDEKDKQMSQEKGEDCCKQRETCVNWRSKYRGLVCCDVVLGGWEGKGRKVYQVGEVNSFRWSSLLARMGTPIPTLPTVPVPVCYLLLLRGKPTLPVGAWQPLFHES